MRFAPQRSTLFEHLNFQKGSKADVLCTFWLGNVLRATTACNFSSHLTRCLHTCRFSEPTFQPSRANKSQWIATFLPLRAPGSSLFWLFLFSDLLSSCLSLLWLFPPLLFHLSILSEVWRLNFLRSVRFKRKINWKYINWFQLKPFLILRFKGASLESKVMVI